MHFYSGPPMHLLSGVSLARDMPLSTGPSICAQAWAEDPARRAAVHVPQQIVFATKPHLARAMVERAIAAGVPFAWVVGDSIYGVSAVEMALRRAGKGYVLGVNSNSQFNSWGPSLRLPEPQPRSPAPSIPLPGSGYRPGPEPRASGCSIGPTWNWPILKPPNTTRTCPAFGPGAF